MTNNRNGHQTPAAYFVIDNRNRQVAGPFTDLKRARRAAARFDHGRRTLQVVNAEGRGL